MRLSSEIQQHKADIAELKHTLLAAGINIKHRLPKPERARLRVRMLVQVGKLDNMFDQEQKALADMLSELERVLPSDAAPMSREAGIETEADSNDKEDED